jgi:hypothetical protein
MKNEQGEEGGSSKTTDTQTPRDDTCKEGAKACSEACEPLWPGLTAEGQAELAEITPRGQSGSGRGACRRHRAVGPPVALQTSQSSRTTEEVAKD